jgi:hypothetical protein
MYSFGNFQQQEVVYIGQETTIFPEYLVLIPTLTKEGTPFLITCLVGSALYLLVEFLFI